MPQNAYLKLFWLAKSRRCPMTSLIREGIALVLHKYREDLE